MSLYGPHAASTNKKPKLETITIEFRDVDGVAHGSQLHVPTDTTTEQLESLVNAFQPKEDEPCPYTFFVKDEPVTSNLFQCLENSDISGEVVVPVTFQPQAVFRVASVGRCTSSLPGHSASILSVGFSPNGRYLASGSGDATVRVWDVDTELPKCTLRGHKDWILAVAWSPDGKRLVTGSKDNDLRVWDVETGKQTPKKPLRGHRMWITCLAWEPEHVSGQCLRIASGSKDGTIKIWNALRGVVEITLSGHDKGVTCIAWGGKGLIYSGSQDKTIKVWEAATGKLVRTLIGHAHWVNTLSLNTEYVLRTGGFNHKGEKEDPKDRYNAMIKGREEVLVSGSDDLTLMVWHPESEKTPVARLTGHQRPVSVVKFSPDGNYIASASFDKGIKLWSRTTLKYICDFRGHVGAVYQMAWSADSRLIVTGSSDSTLKVWDVASKSQKIELPGHADEVFAVDWSPDGARVGSGGRDKVLKFWRR